MLRVMIVHHISKLHVLLVFLCAAFCLTATFFVVIIYTEINFHR